VLFDALHEADVLSVATAMPSMGVGRVANTLHDLRDYIQAHSPNMDPGSSTLDTLKRGVPTATAFLQMGRKSKVIGWIGAAGASELLGATSKKFGRASTTNREICLLPASGCSSHEDFLFGNGISDNAMVPKQGMMAGWIFAARQTYKGDGERLKEDQPKGWGKFIPRALGFFSVVDLCSAFVVYATRNYVCDTPLRTWLLGGILLGGPMDLVIKGISWLLKPRYKYYKFVINSCKNDTNTAFDLRETVFYDEFERELETPFQTRQGNELLLEFSYPVMISGYKIITSNTDAKSDPSNWTLEGSNSKRNWRMVDIVTDGKLPSARGATSELFSDLDTLSEDASFRQAFLCELIATGTALAWLTLGSAWVAASSETCVDSAPELWYYSFLMAVLTWSCIGTVTIGLIVSAVAMIVLGVKAPA